MSKKRVTSFDVARRAGVSRSVVSAVINGTQGIGVSAETRESVLEAMRELHYRVDAQARGMKTGKSYCIGAIGDTSNALFLQLLEGMQKACAARGYYVLLVARGALDEDGDGLVDLYLQRRVDGMISLDTSGYCDEDWAGKTARYGIPFVSVEGYAEYAGVASVLADYRESVQSALQYMYERRQTVPTYIQIYLNDSFKNWAEQQRLQAYLDFCSSKGGEPAVEQVAMEDEDSVFRLVQGSMERCRPLLFLSNWVSGAISLYRVAARLGLTVGQDLHVMSADNTYRVNRYLVPSLSGIDIPYSAMGEKAVEELLGLIAGDTNGKEKHWIATELVPGESC